jgi:hypothetical protein
VTDLERLRECLTLGIGPDALSRLEIGDLSSVDAAVATSGGVLHVDDTPMVVRLDTVARLCASRRSIFGQATAIGDRAVVGPVGDAGRFAPGWRDSLWRLVRGRPDAGRADTADSGGPDAPSGPIRDLPGISVSEYLVGPTAAVVANHLCVSFLKQVAGLPTDAADRFAEVDLETLRLTGRPVAERVTVADLDREPAR